MPKSARTVWIFDLDNTLHDAGTWIFPRMNAAMREYMEQALTLSAHEADELRVRYWQRYGSTLLGLMRHHRVQPAHFLSETHRFPDLEEQVRGHRHDLWALSRLPGRKVLLTNAPREYAMRVLQALRITHLFERVVPIESMTVFGDLRPKPDARMMRRLTVALRALPRDCVLVEDTLEHQKAAARVGWRTVWMQRWLKPRGPIPKEEAPRSPGSASAARARLHRKPAYVGTRLRSLGLLSRYHP